MPRERITNLTDDSTFDVVVTWNRDGTVQVASTAEDADERLRKWTETVDVVPGPGPVTITVGDNAEVTQTWESQPGTSFRTFDGWYAGLDRKAINKLIRVLRTARDQAFGKDE